MSNSANINDTNTIMNMIDNSNTNLFDKIKISKDNSNDDNDNDNVDANDNDSLVDTVDTTNNNKTKKLIKLMELPPATFIKIIELLSKYPLLSNLVNLSKVNKYFNTILKDPIFIKSIALIRNNHMDIKLINNLVSLERIAFTEYTYYLSNKYNRRVYFNYASTNIKSSAKITLE